MGDSDGWLGCELVRHSGLPVWDIFSPDNGTVRCGTGWSYGSTLGLDRRIMSVPAATCPRHLPFAAATCPLWFAHTWIRYWTISCGLRLCSVGFQTLASQLGHGVAYGCESLNEQDSLFCCAGDLMATRLPVGWAIIGLGDILLPFLHGGRSHYFNFLGPYNLIKRKNQFL